MFRQTDGVSRKVIAIATRSNRVAASAANFSMSDAATPKNRSTSSGFVTSTSTCSIASASHAFACSTLQSFAR